MNTSRIRRPVAKKITDGGKRREFIGAGFDEDDRAGGADQPHQRALQREHAGRGRHRREGIPGCRRIRHRILTHSRNATTTLRHCLRQTRSVCARERSDDLSAVAP